MTITAYQRVCVEWEVLYIKLILIWTRVLSSKISTAIAKKTIKKITEKCTPKKKKKNKNQMVTLESI
jgi:hypothetical protein